jgi:hypothetical protein
MRIYKMSQMTTVELVFAKLVYGAELVLDYDTDRYEVEILNPDRLKNVEINFIP